MLEWLIPICFFWVTAAIYLGGFPLEFRNGAGWRHVLGVLASFLLFLLVWSAARAALGGVVGVLGRLALPTALTTLLLPIIARVGFRAMGVRIHSAR